MTGGVWMYHIHAHSLSASGPTAKSPDFDEAMGEFRRLAEEFQFVTWTRDWEPLGVDKA